MKPSTDPAENEGDAQTTDERTPLLAVPDTVGGPPREIPQVDGDINGNHHKSGPLVSEDSLANGGNQGAEEEKPMPLAQVLILCFVSLYDPVTYFSIFPFINEMIERTGDVKPEDVGFWSGAIESLFSLVQMLLMLVYGRVADRIGRKPVLIFSLIGVSMASSLFSVSKTLWQMILFRSMAGLFSGSVVTIRAMISENSTEKTQARAFGWYMFSRNLGILVGPIIGGMLANAATQYPAVFGNSVFLHEYPYALAGFATGALGLSMALTSLFGLKETLERQSADSPKAAAPMSTWEILKSPGVAMVLWIYNQVNLIALCYTAVSTVFMYTPISLGGFSFNPQQISGFLAIAGGSQAVWMLLAFPYLQPRFGTGVVSRTCCYVMPFFMALYPAMNEFLRRGWTTAFWIIAPSTLVLGSSVAMNFACVQLMLNDISPSPAVNATLNALALAITSGIRACMPAIFTSIFAFGVKWRAIDGHLAWICIEVLCIALVVLIQYLPPKAAGAPKRKDSSQQEDEEHDRS